MKFLRKIKHYIQDSYVELMQKVSWPTWSDLQSSAIVVMVAAVIFSVVILVMDLSFKNIVHFIYSLFA